jgi:hypothetical protein
VFNIETNLKPQPDVVESFTVTFTPEQLVYVTAVLGARVVGGSIPRHSQGMYDALAKALNDAGLIDTDWRGGRAQVNDDGVPYALGLLEYLGLKKV